MKNNIHGHCPHCDANLDGDLIINTAIEFFGYNIKSRRFDIYTCERNGNFIILPIGFPNVNGNFNNFKFVGRCASSSR